jgi:pimeloyl-ACP methyl ester carboxylesterase
MSVRDIRAGGLNWTVPATRRTAAGSIPMVLIHGAAGSSRHWSWVMRALPPDVVPLAVDLPGHGQSPGMARDSLSMTASRVRQGIAELCGDGPVAVTGHSVGGMVALMLALTGSVRVSHLALVATAARIVPHPVLLRQLREGGLDEAFLRAGFSTSMATDRVTVILADMHRTRIAPAAADFMDLSRRDLSPHLPQVSAETLVLIARHDLVISPRKSRAMAAAISGARIVTLDGGHYLPLERPEDVATLLTDLVASRMPSPQR